MRKRYFALAVLLSAAALLAPATFAQQAVPEIPFDSAPNFLKLPPDMHLGEVSGVAVNSKGNIFIFTRSEQRGRAGLRRDRVAAARVRQDGKFIREIGKGLYAWSYAHAVRVDKDDNIWAIDKGSDMIVKFNPEGRVTMVFGRKKEASDEAEPWTRVNPPRPPVDGQFRQPTDVAWDTAGQHLHQRRLHQLARRQVHEGRRLGEVVGRARRQQARRTEHAAQHRQRREGQHLRRRPRQPPHSGVRSRRRISSCARSRSMCRSPPDAKPWMGPTPRLRPTGRRRQMAPARRGRSASPRDGHAVSLRSDAFPGPHLQDDARRQGARLAGQVGTSAEAVRLDSRDRLPVGEQICSSASC